MGQRLTAIATRTGDAGTTGLGDGTRVSKDALRIHAMGDVDELNSMIGVLLSEALDDDIRTVLIQVQHDLFDLGGELCIPGFDNIRTAQVTQLDDWLTQFNEALPRLENFILPAGTRAAAVAHVCRTIARRAERSVVTLGLAETVRDVVRQYLNRLSDLLFVLARTVNRRERGNDVLWDQHRQRAPD